MKNIYKLTLNVGLNDQKTHKQKHFTKWYYKQLFKAFEYLQITGATITEATGYFTHDDGTAVIEKSLIIDFYGQEVETIKMLVKLLLKKFNQESIVLTTEYEGGEKEADFIKEVNI
jgi:hypothetical protein